MRCAVVLLFATGCASLIGIDDSRRLTCSELAVIDDTGASAMLSPAFASDHADYTASVPATATTAQVAITCDDADATITVDGAALGSSGRSDPVPVPAMFQIAVRAGTADPAPELDYRVTVGVAP